MYTHVSKYKNDKIKGERKINKINLINKKLEDLVAGKTITQFI
jgi:hypothetical protein